MVKGFPFSFLFFIFSLFKFCILSSLFVDYALAAYRNHKFCFFFFKFKKLKNFNHVHLWLNTLVKKVFRDNAVCMIDLSSLGMIT